MISKEGIKTVLDNSKNPEGKDIRTDEPESTVTEAAKSREDDNENIADSGTNKGAIAEETETGEDNKGGSGNSPTGGIGALERTEDSEPRTNESESVMTESTEEDDCEGTEDSTAAPEIRADEGAIAGENDEEGAGGSPTGCIELPERTENSDPRADEPESVATESTDGGAREDDNKGTWNSTVAPESRAEDFKTEVAEEVDEDRIESPERTGDSEMEGTETRTDDETGGSMEDSISGPESRTEDFETSLADTEINGPEGDITEEIEGAEDSETDELKDMEAGIDGVVETEEAEIEETGTKELKADLQKVREELEALNSKLQNSETKLETLNSKLQNSETELEILKSKSEKSESELQIYKSNFQKYEESVAHFEKEGGRKDYEAMKEVQTDFDKWKTYLLKFVGSFDDFYFDLMELIEGKANVLKAKRVMSFLINMKDKEKTFEAVNILLKDMKEKLDDSENFVAGLPDNLLALKGVNIRGGSDLDYFLPDETFSEDILMLQKQSLNTLLLTLKSLLKAPQEMLKVLKYALRSEAEVCKELQYFDPDALAKALFSKESTPLENILRETDHFLKENFKTARPAEEITDKFRKKYFDLINKTLVKTYNALGEAKKHYGTHLEALKPDLSEQPRVKEWEDIYESLRKMFLDYMKNHLDIEQIECRRGDKYDDQQHKPYGTAESDEELGNNLVKTIVNVGFRFSAGEEDIIIKPTDIIVVNNALR